MSEEIEKELVEEKAVLSSEIVGPFVPFGVTSFADLEAMQDAKASSQMVETLAEQFGIIAKNIMADPEVTDKAAGVSALAGEFSARVQDAMTVKEKWQPLTDRIITKADELKQKPMKTEGGIKFPSSDFAFVPDPDKPSTWKLRLAEGRPGNVTIKQLGRAAAAFSSGGFRGQKVQIPSDKVSDVKAKIRAAYKKLGTKPADIPASIKKEQGFSTWKEADGTTKWLAIYSNNYRDDDKPPEIISAQAHKDFIKAVDDGEWPMPVLRYWHVPGTEFGTTEMLAYDDASGMTMAMGSIDKGKEHIIEKAGEEPHLVSHGMPSYTIERDASDPTIITRYRTAEISPLPAVAAANKITAFMTIEKEKENMTIPEKKLEQLEKVGFDTDELQAKLEAAKAKAEDQERESKETDAIEDTPPVEPVETPVAPVEAQPEPLTTEVIAAAFTSAMEPLLERLEAVEGQIKEMAQPESEEKEKPLDLTPAASLADMMRSAVIGSDAARVDGRQARHDAPKETKSASRGGQILNSKNPLANDLINTILDPDGSWLNDLPGMRQQ